MQKIIISAESTCDLSAQQIKDYELKIFPFTIILDDKIYKDNIDITPYQIFDTYKEKGILPKTSAINVAEYYTYFKPWIDDGYEVVHLTLSSAITSSYKNCCDAAAKLKGVYPIDTHNLSTGVGLLLLRAANMRKEGLSAKEISDRLVEHRDKINVSFVIDTLDYIYAGGRCSKVESLGANLLSIKPSFYIDTKTGTISVGKKYRGKIEKVVYKYIKDTFQDFDIVNNERLFISHSMVDENLVKRIRLQILEHLDFKEVHITNVGSTISTHCGPNTFGLAYETL